MTAHHKHLLVIDDAAELRTLFAAILEDAGYRVSLRGTTPALAEVAQLRPDAIVLDLLLGDDEDRGWEFIVAMRDHPKLRPVPIVVCSAATALVQRLGNLFAETGVAFVAKPFELDVFLATIERATTGPRSG